ncbi:lymphoid-restricted membrane protein isoform 2 [Silurus asotus]|uniref:Lymphoid-restricted membrane protein isoform 2 n=1 Tax=Silurus asotus TaxID=30991 RepID=A0AAD5AMS8_SILAS|nr:lymphoid-restricted membrane protein isoform 2 [Silurus asotus]
MHCVEEYASLHIPEEQQNEVLDTGADKAELLHSNHCLRTLYADMQKAVEMAEDNNMLLRAENNDLKNQIKSSRQSIQNLQLLVNELEDIRAANAEKDQICGEIQASQKQLAKENETLKQQIDELSSEASSFLLERQQQDEEIANLSSVLRSLQQQLEEQRLDVEHKEELLHQKDLIIEQLKDNMSEYITINQMIPEQEQVEEEKNTETREEQAALYVSKSVTHSCSGSIKRGACAAVVLCFSMLGVFGALTPTLSTDVLDTIRHLIEPYCRLHHTGLPPV